MYTHSTSFKNDIAANCGIENLMGVKGNEKDITGE